LQLPHALEALVQGLTCYLGLVVQESVQDRWMGTYLRIAARHGSLLRLGSGSGDPLSSRETFADEPV
jgi:hypothetical protein